MLERADREAERIIEAARVRAERMVETHRGRARGPPRPRSRSSSTATGRPRQIRHEAEDYVDRKLAAFEVVLDRTMQQVQKGRERLQVNIPDRSRSRPDAEDDAGGFFDQDEL